MDWWRSRSAPRFIAAIAAAIPLLTGCAEEARPNYPARTGMNPAPTSARSPAGPASSEPATDRPTADARGANRPRIVVAPPPSSPGVADCTFNGKPLWGKVQVVDAFPDIKVQRVDAFPMLKVQKVDAFPDSCGKWQFVDAFPDIKIQFVDAFPDVTIQFVDSFPGVGG
jgi:hypothetical protein